jgi:hypothetical protein
MHELGHVLGAIHPGDLDGDGTRFEVEPGEDGVMCKDTCTNLDDTDITVGVDVTSVFPSNKNIFTADFYSEPNKNRILNIDRDHKDDEGDARNLATVSTAASE